MSPDFFSDWLLWSPNQVSKRWAHESAAVHLGEALRDVRVGQELPALEQADLSKVQLAATQRGNHAAAIVPQKTATLVAQFDGA